MSGEGEPLPPVPDAWDPPTLVTQFGDRWTVEKYVESTHRANTAGISGLWFREEGVMVVTPRRVHHNVQLGTLDRNDVFSRWDGQFVPWVWDTWTMDDFVGGAELDFPRSAGGAWQWMSRNDPPNLTYIRSGDEVDENDVYAVVYTCRRVDVPGETDATLEYLPLDAPYSKGTVNAREFGVRREQRPLEDWYREMRFADVLPERGFKRDLDVD